MARNFRIKVVTQNKNIVFELSGNVDGSSAALILRKLEDYEGLPVILDFSKVRECHPFGLNVIKWTEHKGVVIRGLRDSTSS